MSEQQNVTLGEVYRLCQRIETAVNTTNGRVTALEKDAIRFKAIWTSGTVAAVVAYELTKDWVKRKLGL